MKIRTTALAAAAATLSAFLVVRFVRARARAKITALDDAESRRLLALVRSTLDATLEAFAFAGTELSEFEKRDARAIEAGHEFDTTLEALRPKLRSLEAPCDTLAEMLRNARLALMAFAINRKNRGAPDSAQTEAEAHDRKALKRDAEPIFAELVAALT